MADKEKMALAILRLKPGGAGGSKGSPEPDDAGEKKPAGVGLEAAMQSVGEALDNKDWAAAADAFRSAHEICAGYEE